MSGPADTTPSRDLGGGGDDADPAVARYLAVQHSAEFQELRSRYRRFVFPVTFGALAFYFTYVLMAAYWPSAMAEPVLGKINVGLIFGLAQFVMTFGVTFFYVRFARTVLDPRAEAIRADLEQGAAR